MKTKKCFLFFIILQLFAGVTINAQKKITFPLWEVDIPEALGTNDEDRPEITVYLADTTKETDAVLVCPGGGYSHLAMDHEGVQVAEWFNSIGVTAVVLKYRIDNKDGSRYHHPVQLMDAKRAMRLVRHNASQWKLKKIGVMGFSAGGHLASTLGTHYDNGLIGGSVIDQNSSKPDFMILIYPVITFSNEDFVHKGSRSHFLGDKENDEQLRKEYSSELQVTPSTSPTIMVHSEDDKAVPIENSKLFLEACKNNNVPCELITFSHGGHGFGLGKDDPELSTWPGKVQEWLFKVKNEK